VYSTLLSSCKQWRHINNISSTTAEALGEDYEEVLRGNVDFHPAKSDRRRTARKDSYKLASPNTPPLQDQSKQRNEQKNNKESTNYKVHINQNDHLTQISAMSMDDLDWLDDLCDKSLLGAKTKQRNERNKNKKFTHYELHMPSSTTIISPKSVSYQWMIWTG
jgi:hypothetical protein